MKKQIIKITSKIIYIVFLCTFLNINLFSQQTPWIVGGNFIGAGQNPLLGTTNNFPVSIITNNINRLYLNAPNFGNGFVGIGSYFSKFNQPQSLLHIDGNDTIMSTGEVFRTNCPKNIETNWRMYRSDTLYGRLFTSLRSKNFQLEASQNDLIFNAGGDTGRMCIVGKDRWNEWDLATINAGNVGIETQGPMSMLHIGGDNESDAGWRPWMRIGTFYSTDDGGVDNMYVGVRELHNYGKNPNIDSTWAVISWGDNPAGTINPSTGLPAGDRLMFLFTGDINSGIASDSDGIEVAHMWSNGNETRTRFGFDSNLKTLDPQNTVHIIGAAERDTMKGGNSGLMFQKLTSSTIPTKNPGTGVLSVNKKGDVIYVLGGGGNEKANNGTSIFNGKVVLGNDLNGKDAQLSSNREIPMGNHDILFTDPTPPKPDSTETNRIGIGMTESQLSPDIRLEVRGSISIYDGNREDTINNGDHSLFFGREQDSLNLPAKNYGEWGIQYMLPNLISNPLGGLNFWKPYGSSGNWGNAWLFLANNGNIGVNTANPINRAEITSGVWDSTKVNPTSSSGLTRSGLRFTNLNATMRVDDTINSTNKLLSVNNTGDVILVPGKKTAANNGTSISGGKVVLGNDIGQTLAKLDTDREIPMNNHDIVFTDPNDTVINLAKNRIGIGMAEDSLSPTIKLEVRGSISIYDGSNSNNNGDHSLFFGREQTTLNNKDVKKSGEWGIQYLCPDTSQGNNHIGGLNFWKPYGSDGSIVGNGWGNYFIFLSNNGNTGINEPNPVNRMQITSGVWNDTIRNPISSNVPTRSGLRFTNLNAKMKVDGDTNSTKTVLSLNNTGDVILVNGNNGLGGECGTSPSPLTKNWEIPLGGNHYIFSGQGYDATNKVPSNSVGIGTVCLPSAKLDVLENTGTTEGSTGLNVWNRDVATNDGDSIIGIKSSVNSTDNRTINHIAGLFKAANAENNYGVTGVSATATGGNAINFAIKGNSSGGNFNYGIYGYANGGLHNYGVYGKVIENDTNSYAIYGDADSIPNAWAGYFNGKVKVNGNLDYSGSLIHTSDSLFKLKVDYIKNVGKIIKLLKPHSFYFDTTNIYGINFSSSKQYGLIAQDVKKVLPEVVKTIKKPATYDSKGNELTPSISYKGIDYTSFIAILIQFAKEQQKTIDSLKSKTESMKIKMDSMKTLVNKQQALLDTLNSKNLNERLTELEAVVNQCCNKNSETEKKLGMQETDLSNGEAIVLDQNVPNPFAESTTISYFIPDDITSAQIIFTDNTGRVMKTVDIQSKRQGMLKVYAQDLSSGIYSYTLVADGKTIDSKKMIKLK